MDRLQQGHEISKLYDQWARTYDTDLNRTRDLSGLAIRSDLASLASGDVVELGCGTGANTAWLAKTARSVIAVDFSSDMLEKAQARLAGARHVSFLHHDIRTPLELSSGSADLVVVALVLEHVQDVAAVIADCRRVLRSDAYLYICELHPIRQWMGAQAEFVDKATEGTVKVPAYRHDVSGYLNAAVSSGLRLVKTEEPRDELDRQRDAPPRLLTVLAKTS